MRESCCNSHLVINCRAGGSYMLCSVCVVYTEQGECSIGKVIRSLLGALLLLRNKSPPLLEELGKLGKGTFQAFSLFQMPSNIHLVVPPSPYV